MLQLHKEEVMNPEALQDAIDKVFEAFDSKKYKMNVNSIWSLCSNNDLYTCGDTRQYNEMLNKVRDASCFKDIYDIRDDIWYHSDSKTLEENGITRGNLLSTIMKVAVYTMED